MAAGFPKQCCVSGSLHTGTPTGAVTKIHGLDCYVAKPPEGTEPKGIVVIIPDMFGWTLPNTRVLADEYAKKGPFLVYAPDFMFGPGMPHDLILSIEALFAPGLPALLKKIYHALKLMRYFIPFAIRSREGKVIPHITSFFKKLRENEGATLPVGAAGFCWGGKPVVVLCHDSTKASNGRSLVDAGFIAHPSFLAMPDDAEKVAKPLSCAYAGKDGGVLIKQCKQAQGIFERKNKEVEDREGGQGVRHEVVWYEEANHGFAVRANEKDVEEAERGRKAEAQAVGWFQRWFGEFNK